MLPKNLEEFKRALSRLPGIGMKTAERLGFYILSQPEDFALGLSEAIRRLKENARICSRCGNISDSDPCELCTDFTRDKTQLCVVETAMDIYYLEETGFYRGLYHVLGGVLSPLNGITPGDLDLEGILKRIRDNRTEEIIVATSPTTEGDTTALYIKQMVEEAVRDRTVRITHLARGIPMGTDLQYAGRISLAQALKNRETI